MYPVNKGNFFIPFFLLVPWLSVWSQIKIPSPTIVSFKKIQLMGEYVLEGASIGDIDAYDFVDIVAGNLWWKGPDLKEIFAYGPVEYFPITAPRLEGYSANLFTFPFHIDNDSKMNVVTANKKGFYFRPKMRIF